MIATHTFTHTHVQEGRCAQLTQDLNKEKEETNSLNIKVKWAQNKLKTETEAHKVTGRAVHAVHVVEIWARTLIMSHFSHYLVL